MHSPWMRLFALASLLAAPACLVDPVDFTGKTCVADSDCADGYRCSAGKCVSGSAAPDASPGPVDAALPGDASLGRDGAVGPGDAEVEPPDAEVIAPSDAEVVEPADAGKKADGSVPTGDAGPAADTGPRSDAAVVTPPDATVVTPADATVLAPDGGIVTPPDGSVVQPPDASVTPPDAGGGCTQDSDCKALGAFYCSGSGACLPCNTDQKCGAACSTCSAGTSCDGTACAPCATDLKCGLACAPCATGTSCNGTSCQPCTTDAKCGPACSTCGAGTYCAAVGPGGSYSCTGCNVPAHCGPTCSACSSPLPACGASGCAECTATSPCAIDGLFCLNERCVQCRDDSDCPAIGGVGRWCDTSTHTCQSCKDNLHCGDSCVACAPPTPVCDGSQCVACVLDADCTDSGTGTYCCNRRCIVPEVPKLAGFTPLSATPGATVDLTLYGTGFNECSQVRVDAAPASVTWLGNPTKLAATLRLTTATGGRAVVVHNPGLGGGDSSPNSWSLGADLPTSSSSTGIAYVPGADLVALASDSSAVEVFDPAGFMLVTDIPLGNRPFGIAAGFKSLVVSLRDDQRVFLFPSFPDATYSQIFVSNSAAWVDVDPATAMGIVVGTSPDEVQYLDLAAEAITRSIPISSPSTDLFGVAYDGRYPDTAFVAYNNRAGFVQPSGSFNQVTSSGSPYAISVDRLNHEVFHERLTGNTVYAYPFPGGGSAGNFAVGTPGNSAIVPHEFGARVLITALDSGTGALQFADWGAKSSLGAVGPARNRMCTGTGSTRGQPDAIAIDPTRNRAFVANSCDKVLEGYNLNILFVK